MMRKIKITFFFTAMVLTTGLVVLPAKVFSTAGNGLKEIIENECKKFEQVAVANGLPWGGVVFDNTANTHVDGENTHIVINLEDMERFTIGKDEKLVNYFVKFIIAHELGHKLQYHNFHEQISTSQGEALLFLECQADILSGLFVSQEYNLVEIPTLRQHNPEFDIQEFNKQNQGLVFSAFSMILEMENINNDKKTHPDNITRLTAFRNGKMAGDILTVYYATQFTDPSQHRLPAAQIQALKETYALFSSGLDFDPSDNQKNNIYTWSHAEAIRLIHENNSISNNLVLYDKYQEWNTNPDTPVVYFSFKILNRNDFPVDFSGRVYVEIIPKADRENIINIAPVSGYVFNKNIPGHDTVEIEGQLDWIADKDYMPQLVCPGESRSEYWVFAIRDKYLDSSPLEQFSLSPETWTSEGEDEITDLINYVYLRRAGFNKMKKGLGLCLASSSEEISSFAVRFFPKFILQNSQEENIYFEERGQKTNFIFKSRHWPDSAIAQQYFTELVAKIKESVSGLTLNQAKSGTENKYASFANTFNRRAISVSVRYDYLLKDYYLSVNIAEQSPD